MDVTGAGFGPALLGSLPEAQSMAESLMTLTLTAYEPNGQAKDSDGYTIQGYTPRGSVPGKIQRGGHHARDTATRYVRIGEVNRPVLEGGLHIPLSATVPKPGEDRGKGWEYEVTAVGDYDDPALLGRRFLVVEVPAKSFATARRLNIVEVS